MNNLFNISRVMNVLRVRFIFLFLCGVFCLGACKKNPESPLTRSFRMGFQNSAPRPDFNLYIRSLQMWTSRADAAMISAEVPWDSLYNGVTAENYVIHNFKSLADYYRTLGFKLWVYIDPENGLNRASDSDGLRAMNKSISQSDVQLQYQHFVIAMDTILRPDHLGLALETNLIRDIAPDSIYQGVKSAANVASVQIRNLDPTVKLSISVQVDWAWGKLNSNGGFSGVDQDFADFPFIQELGMSSYPYFGFNDPQDIPENYYSRLVEGRSVPVFVSEGGWSSVKVAAYDESLQKQEDYIVRQSQLLDNVKATAVFQLVFTDLDVNGLPTGSPANISLFANMGLVDTSLNPKPALSAWDQIFRRKYTPVQ